MHPAPTPTMPARPGRVRALWARAARDETRDPSWPRRHRLVVFTLLADAFTILAMGWGPENADANLAVAGGAAVGAFAAASVALAARSRRGAAISATIGLICASALFALLTDSIGGGAGAHAAIAVVVVSFYDDVVCLAFVGVALVATPTIAALAGSTVGSDEIAWTTAAGGLWAAVMVSTVVERAARAETERLSEERALILDAISDGLWRVDNDGIVRFQNPAAAAMLGRDESDLPAHACALAHGEDRPQPCQLADTIAAWSASEDGIGEAVTHEDAFWAAGGRLVQVAWTARPLGDGGGVVILRDLTLERQAEAERAARESLRVQAETAAATLAQLQAAIAPPLPALDGVSADVHFLPAEDAPIGGDLYDVTTLPDGTVQASVVDVTGHGVEAAAAAIDVLHTIKVLSLAGTPLGDLIERAHEHVSHTRPGLKATAVIARLNPRTGRLRIAGGGHPPAMVFRSDGLVEEHAVRGYAIGIRGARSFAVTDTTLAPGEGIVLYTDGLVEVGCDIIEGLAELRTTLGQVRPECGGGNVDGMARRLVEGALAGRGPNDDTLALVLALQAQPD